VKHIFWKKFLTVSLYFDPRIQTRHANAPHIDDGVEQKIEDKLSIFKHLCRPTGKSQYRFLIDDELHISETYLGEFQRNRILSSISFIFNF